MLDVGATVSPNVAAIKEVSLFLLTPGTLPSDAALGLYVSVGGAAWSYRGYVAATHPSEVLPLAWPTDQTGAAVVGVSIEPLGTYVYVLLLCVSLWWMTWQMKCVQAVRPLHLVNQHVLKKNSTRTLPSQPLPVPTKHPDHTTTQPR